MGIAAALTLEPAPRCHIESHGFQAILQCRKRRPDRKPRWPKTMFNEWRPGWDKARHSLVPSLRPISFGAFGPKPRRFTLNAILARFRAWHK